MHDLNISRRALAAGLALAPVAGLPALAGAVSADDPVFAALAELERVKTNVETVGKVHSAAEEAIFEARAPGFVEFEGEQIRNLAHLDAVFKGDGALSREAALSIFRNIRAKLPPRLSPVEKAARDATREAEYSKARAQLERVVAAEAEAHAQSGFDEAEAKWNDATSRENEAEDAIFACEPRTTAGALALLRFVADHAANFSADYFDTAGAIRRALEVLEANGRA
jgi:hypothetical protein